MNYYDIDAISYSGLFALSINPLYYKNRKKEQSDKKHFTIGTCVDILLTEPEEFNKKYYIEFQEKCEEIPSPQLVTFIEALISTGDDITAYNQAKFKRKSDTLEAIKEKLNNEGKTYYEHLLKKQQHDQNNTGKIEINEKTYNLAIEIVQNLQTNKFTYKYINPADNNLEIINQLEILWEFKENKCKSKLDKVLIDHINRTIQMVDIKTTGDYTTSFKTSFLRWRYDLQASFYSSALFWLINYSKDEIWSKYQGYTILPFKFVVESTKSPGTPLVYTVNEKILNDGAMGFIFNGKYYKGWIQLLEELNWHNETNIWEYSKDVVENDGVIMLEYD